MEGGNEANEEKMNRKNKQENKNKKLKRKQAIK